MTKKPEPSNWLDRELVIYTAPLRNSKVWKREVTTWRQFLARLNNQADHKECGNYLLGWLKGDIRRKSTILGRTGLAFDADYAGNIEEFLAAVRRVLGPVPFAYYTTWRSTPAEPRLRLLVPTLRDLTPDEYRHVVESIMTQVGRSYFDPGSSEPERYMFLPSAQNPAHYRTGTESLEEKPLNVDDYLIDFLEDLSDEHVPQNKLRHKRNPYEIDGVIGAFNRAFSIPDVISEFSLPYEPSGDRWHLIGARAIAGMAEVGDGLAFSHHATDPAFGVACNAFDLARLHLFGELDDEADLKPNTPINRLPSTKAMLELASTNTLVVRELVGDDFASSLDAFADEETDAADAAKASTNWVDQLRIVAATGAVEDCIHNWDMIVANDPIMSNIAHNRLTGTDDFTTRPPWAPDTEEWDSVVSRYDLVEIKAHIEKRYRVKLPTYAVEELVMKAGTSRTFHPIYEYLRDLPPWDGVARIEHWLPATPTPYVRMVARKTLVAAVARIFSPGKKYDHMIILRGGEGIGKSTLLDTIFLGLSSPLGKLGLKDTILTAHRSWLVLADEAYAMSKADQEQLKEFITLRADVFRTPYDRSPRAVPRGFVFAGTTNDLRFLTSGMGNRRYLPVECDREVDWSLIQDPAYLAQLWAEAVHYYRQGEPLYLNESESAVGASVRESFTADDSLLGLVEEYVNVKVPEDWGRKSPEDRAQWLSDYESMMVPEGTEEQDILCSMQVWVEVLRRRRGDHKRSDLRDITKTLRELKGWEELPGRHRCGPYGTQLAFRRINEDNDLKDIL